ncbi:TPA: hypothetical protein DIC39_03510 [Patescibacteria group bacterium]|nr:hypothetical protein [Patescibacteria group bacterium]HCU48091.1 hypothetical protein [Patescibacteria group bacterium]
MVGVIIFAFIVLVLVVLWRIHVSIEHKLEQARKIIRLVCALDVSCPPSLSKTIRPNSDLPRQLAEYGGDVNNTMYFGNPTKIKYAERGHLLNYILKLR